MPKNKTVFEDCDVLVVGGGMAGTGATFEARHWGRNLKSLAAQKLERLFSEIIEQGGYRDADPRELATGYSALIDGLHLGLLVTPRELTKRRARAVARDFLRRAFPKHIR